MNTNIKVITLWQPYATLWMLQEKKLETRPSTTSHIGTYLIHAAKVMNKDMKELCEDDFFANLLKKHGYNSWQDLPTGKILGSYLHQECKVITPARIDKLSEKEFLLGNYETGRYTWSGTDFRTLDEPFNYTNGQGCYRSYKGDMGLIKPLIHKTKNLFSL